jgi:hypothetical protein
MARSTDRKNRVLRVRASSLVAAHESVGALLRLHQCRERGPDSAHAACRGRGEGQVAVWFLPARHVVHWLPALDCDPKANQGAMFAEAGSIRGLTGYGMKECSSTRFD